MEINTLLQEKNSLQKDFLAGNLSQDILYQIFSYLDIKCLLLCSRVNKNWNLILKKDHPFLKIGDDITIKPNQAKNFLNWILNKIKICKPSSISIYDKNLIWRPYYLEEIFAEENFNLREVNIFFESPNNKATFKIMSYLVTNCPNIEIFRTTVKFIDDKSSFLISQLTKLKEFYLENYHIEFKGKFFETFPPLEKIFLRPHNIKFKRLFKFIKNSRNFLKSLSFDCEILEPEQLEEIIEVLEGNIIEELEMSFCEVLTNEIFYKLIKFKN